MVELYFSFKTHDKLEAESVINFSISMSFLFSFKGNLRSEIYSITLVHPLMSNDGSYPTLIDFWFVFVAAKYNMTPGVNSVYLTSSFIFLIETK